MANEDWKERRTVLLLTTFIMTTFNFDDNGLCTDVGEHARCDLATIYFNLRAESGEGEELWYDNKLYTIFSPTYFERQVFGLSMVVTNTFQLTRTNGAVLGRELLPEQVDELRARCHSDNPDDEVYANLDNHPSMATDHEGDEDATPHGDGEISF